MYFFLCYCEKWLKLAFLMLRQNWKVKDTEFKIPCFVNIARVLFLSTCVVLVWVSMEWSILSFVDNFMNTLYQFIWFATSHFGKEMVIPYFTLFVNKINIWIELWLHNNKFLPRYLACNLTFNIYIFTNYSEWTSNSFHK